MRNTFYLFVTLLVAAGVAACGNKGDLVKPTPPATQQPSGATPTPAPAATQDPAQH